MNRRREELFLSCLGASIQTRQPEFFALSLSLPRLLMRMRVCVLASVQGKPIDPLTKGGSGRRTSAVKVTRGEESRRQQNHDKTNGV